MPPMTAQACLEAKFCMRTYKMFFVAGTEDWFIRRHDQQPTFKERDWSEAKRRFEGWLEERSRAAAGGEGEEGEGEQKA
jgi:hypothetical protein